MNEKLYAVVNIYDYGRRMVEFATFTDYWSAKQFARHCIHDRAVALPEDYGHLEVMRHNKGQNFHYGDQLFKIMPDGEEFEAEGEK